MTIGSSWKYFWTMLDNSYLKPKYEENMDKLSQVAH